MQNHIRADITTRKQLFDKIEILQFSVSAATYTSVSLDLTWREMLKLDWLLILLQESNKKKLTMQSTPKFHWSQVQSILFKQKWS